jgi:hypothetical protein
MGLVKTNWGLVNPDKITALVTTEQRNTALLIVGDEKHVVKAESSYASFDSTEVLPSKLEKVLDKIVDNFKNALEGIGEFFYKKKLNASEKKSSDEWMRAYRLEEKHKKDRAAFEQEKAALEAKILQMEQTWTPIIASERR